MCQQTYTVYIYINKLYCVILWYVPISQTLQWCSLSTQRCKKPISVLNNSTHCFFKSGEPQESSNICRVRKWGFTLRGFKSVPMGSPSKPSYHLKQPFFFCTCHMWTIVSTCDQWKVSTKLAQQSAGHHPPSFDRHATLSVTICCACVRFSFYDLAAPRSTTIWTALAKTITGIEPSIISASESSVAAFQRQKLKGCWEKLKKFWAEWLYGKKSFLRVEPSIRRYSQNP